MREPADGPHTRVPRARPAGPCSAAGAASAAADSGATVCPAGQPAEAGGGTVARTDTRTSVDLGGVAEPIARQPRALSLVRVPAFWTIAQRYVGIQSGAAGGAVRTLPIARSGWLRAVVVAIRDLPFRLRLGIDAPTATQGCSKREQYQPVRSPSKWPKATRVGLLGLAANPG